MVLRVKPDRAIWGDDKRPDVEPRPYPNRSPDNEGHTIGGRQHDERGQTRITLREGQVIGEIQLIARQRQLRKDENLCLFFCCGVDESNVAFDVGVDITPPWDRLGGSYRARACHVDTLARPFAWVSIDPPLGGLTWRCS
jgi:hypothetical protein